jgi:hypothetical protein
MYNIFIFNYLKYKKVILTLMNIEKIPELCNVQYGIFSDLIKCKTITIKSVTLVNVSNYKILFFYLFII